MTSKKRLGILLADDGSQHAQSAVELLRGISLPPRSRIMVLRVFNPARFQAYLNLKMRSRRQRTSF